MPCLTLYLDYIVGKDLSKRITPSGFSTTRDVEKHIIWKNMSDALDFIHRQGVIHHDIKPSNIIYDEQGCRAVLCDFESATIGPKLHYGGTPSYVAPDILLQIERSEPDDIWALGITMLFVSGLIPLPRHSWVIADIKEFEPETIDLMKAWLLQVQRTCLRLPKSFSLLRCMLTESRAKRITASQLSAKLTQSLCLEVS